MKPSDDELDVLLKQLHLASARRIWPQLVQRAEKQEWSYRDFLGILVAEEIAQRPADTPAAALAPRRLPVSQDHRRLRLHLSVHAAPVAAGLGSLA